MLPAGFPKVLLSNQNGVALDAGFLPKVELGRYLHPGRHEAAVGQIGGSDFRAGQVFQVLKVHLVAAVVEHVDHLVRQHRLHHALRTRHVLAHHDLPAQKEWWQRFYFSFLVRSGPVVSIAAAHLVQARIVAAADFDAADLAGDVPPQVDLTGRVKENIVRATSSRPKKINLSWLRYHPEALRAWYISRTSGPASDNISAIDSKLAGEYGGGCPSHVNNTLKTKDSSAPTKKTMFTVEEAVVDAALAVGLLDERGAVTEEGCLPPLGLGLLASPLWVQVVAPLVRPVLGLGFGCRNCWFVSRCGHDCDPACQLREHEMDQKILLYPSCSGFPTTISRLTRSDLIELHEIS